VSASVAERYLKEFDAEMASTRRLLERVPADRLDWKPHGKSRSLGELATHVAELPRWGVRFLGDSFQVGSEKAPALKSAAEFVARFDENVAAGRAGIAKTTDEAMAAEFTVRKPDGQVFFQLPRRALVRRVILSHLIHHRGQLTVYLRMQDVPLPPVYGPTADEGV
jgi:uncharacterized damage-inducible protein DinB